MSLKSSRVAGFLSSLLITSTVSAACFAQPAWNYDRVVSCKDDADNNAILISTMKGAPIGAPTIQYLPGPNGHAMMVADFAGLSYIMPPHIIHPAQTPGKWGIEEIRIGQFQVNPPVCRVAAISRNPASLKGLSFTSNSGTLIVKWTGARGLIPDQPETAEAAHTGNSNAASAESKGHQVAQGHTATMPDGTSATSVKSAKPGKVGSIATADLAKNSAISTSGAATRAKPAVQVESDSAALTGTPSVSISNQKSVTDLESKTTSSKSNGKTVAKSGEDKSPAPPSIKAAYKSSRNAASDDDDIDRGIQHIQELIEAARRSKIAPVKPAAKEQTAQAPLRSLPTEPPVRAQIETAPVAPSRTASTQPAISDNASIGNKVAVSGKTSIGDKTPIGEKTALIEKPAAVDKTNKLLTTASQDQTNTTDTIKKPAAAETTSAKPKGDVDTAEATQTPELPSKEKSDSLRADKKNEKPPGVPMARLSVVSDTESSEPNAAIQLLSERNLTYKSFRLHSPERYIIDLEKPADLDEATVSIFQDNSLCRSVRIGMTDKHTCRLVFDLASDSVQVQEKTFEEDGRVLTLKIFTQPPSVTTKSDRPLEGVSLVLDAGHGGSDPGAQRGDAREKEMTLGIINQLKKRLEANGAFITMTRSDDTFVSLEDRVKITNLVMPKAFVSVHINALESTNDIKGVETYFQTDQSKPLAEAVHNCLYTNLKVPNRGVRKARFYVINHTTVPAILAEVGYISNKDEREKLISSDYQGKIADALTQGVILYVSQNPETPANTVKTAPVINFNQSAGKGTTAIQTKSVAESLSDSGPLRTAQ